VQRRNARNPRSKQRDPETPYWDPEARALWFRGELVTRYLRVPRTQQRILDAFQEENWTRRIDDPLPPHGTSNPKHRLRDTIANLNQRQKKPLIRFFSDGTGEGVCWRPVDES